MLRIMNKCENGWMNFSAKFQGRGIKIDRVNSIRAISIILFDSRGSLSDVIMSYRFLCVELASTSLSLYTLDGATF